MTEWEQFLPLILSLIFSVALCEAVLSAFTGNICPQFQEFLCVPVACPEQVKRVEGRTQR